MMMTLLNPLLGIGVELAISWLLLWLIEKRNLNALGFSPTRQRISGFFLFLIITAIFCWIQFLMRMFLAREQWQLNPAVSADLIIRGVWWNLTSVLYEELIFRGAILYILIHRIGSVKAIIISSIAFGIYHWFSYGIWGNIPQMTFTFFTTGFFGALLAFAFVKTASLYVPISIHYGWNITYGFIFSQGSIGNGIFIPVKDQPQVTISYFTFYCIMFLPLLIMLFTNFFLLKRTSVVQ